jgi:rhodanese-related sulfurtransferase
MNKLGGYNINSKLETSSPFILNVSLIGYPTQIIVPYLEKEGIILSGLSTCSIKTNTPNKLTKIGFNPNIANSSIRICIDTNNDLDQAEALIEKLEDLKKEFLKIDLTEITKSNIQIQYDQIIDVRELSESEEDPIENSKNIPLFELISNPDKYISREESYAIVCQTGKRADIAVKMLKNKGYFNIEIN